MVEFSDRESAEAWLMGQSHVAQVALAARGALRAFPHVATADGAKLREIILPAQRAILTAGLAGIRPNSAIAAAAHSAALSAARAAFSARYNSRSAARTVLFAARSADSAAQYTESEAQSALSAARPALSTGRSAASAATFDANWLEVESSKTLFEIPLWQHPMPSEVENDYLALSEFWDENPEVWGFWKRWYEGMLRGQPVDWDTQEGIALLPSEAWEKGPAHIQKLIAEIEENGIVKNPSLHEILGYNEGTGKFEVIPHEKNNSGLIEVTLSLVEDALEDALSSQGNSINENSYEARVLRRTLSKYRSDPQRIEMDFASVHAAMNRQLIQSELPDSEEILALLRALDECAIAIRANHPEIAKNRRKLSALKLKELSDSEALSLKEVLPVLQKISEGNLRDDFVQDIRHILLRRSFSQGSAAVTSRFYPRDDDERVRTFSRIAGIRRVMEYRSELQQFLETLLDMYLLPADLTLRRGISGSDGLEQDKVNIRSYGDAAKRRLENE